MTNTVDKTESRIAKEITVFGIALLVYNVVIQIYLLDGVRAFVADNISASNLIPYVLFAVVFIGANIACRWIFKSSNIGERIATAGKVKSLIFAWGLVAVNGVAILLSYIREEYTFDGPVAAEFRHHQHEWLSLAVMLAVMVVCVAVAHFAKADFFLWDKWKALTYVVAVGVALILAYVMFTPNSYKVFHSLYHSNAYYNSIFNYMAGEPRTELNGSVYGNYGMLLVPLVKLAGGTYTAYYYVIGALLIIEFLCLAYIMVNLVKSNIVRLLGILAMGVYNASFSWSVYRQLIPHRVLFACILLAYVVYMYKHGIHKAIGYIICTFAMIWNFETGIVYLLAYVAFFMLEVIKDHSLKTAKFWIELLKKMLWAVLSFAGALGLVNVVNLCMGGGFVTVQMFIFPLVSGGFVTGTLTVPYEKGIVAWMFIAAFAMLMISNGIGKTKLAPQGAGGAANAARTEQERHNVEDASQRSLKDNVLFMIGVVALGQMIYYINRPAYGNLVIAYFIAVLMMCIVCDKCIVSYKTNLFKSTFLKELSKGFASLLAAVMVVLLMGGVFNWSNAQAHREAYAQKDMETVKGVITQIQDICKKDTKALGLTVPMLYSEMGWDSYYHIIDFADIGLCEEAYTYLENELNNELREPILIEQYALDKLEEEISLSVFYEKFRTEATFELYDTQLVYYVPKNNIE